jgi:hypothetical protein
LWRVDHGQGSKDIVNSTFSRKLNSLLVTMDKKSRSGVKKINGKGVRGFAGIQIRSEWKKELLEQKKIRILFKKTGK